MNKKMPLEKKRIEQICTIKEMERLSMLKKASEMVTVFQDEKNLDNNSEKQFWYNRFPLFIPNSITETVLAEYDWDAHFTEAGKPTVLSRNGELSYDRFNLKHGMEPLIICRHFSGILPSYNEISEEFRLFHGLYFDEKYERYLKLNEEGDEEIVAIVTPCKIQIRLKEIRKFLAIKKMHLSVQFNFTEYSPYTLEEIGIQNQEKPVKTKKGNLHFAIGFANDGLSFGNFRSLSDMKGKFLITPLPIEQCSYMNFLNEKEKPIVHFIIDENEEGDEILSNDLERYEYLTPVCFSKNVLTKYYQEDSKYHVEPMYISRKGVWGTYIDNNHDDVVYAWLGDLQRDLPYKEQIHWRIHNIIPEKATSEVFSNNQLYAIPTNSNREDAIFKKLYDEFYATCIKKLGWPIFLSLVKEDAYCLTKIILPITNEQSEFDNLVGYLAKVIPDSINNEKLSKLLTLQDGDLNSEIASIGKLELIFQHADIDNYEEHIQSLRYLQRLRSSGAAHRKGTKYFKVFNKRTGIFLDRYKKLLSSSIELINYLDKNIDIFISSEQ